MQFLLLTVTAAGTCTVGGVFFAFSSLVMPALGRLPGNAGMMAMRQIDVTVFGSSFLWLMFGALAFLLASIFFLPSLDARAATWLIAAIVVYAVGSIGITMVFNVPLNERLAKAPADDLHEWANYLKTWTAWNTVRAVASISSAVMLIMVLASSSTK